MDLTPDDLLQAAPVARHALEAVADQDWHRRRRAARTSAFEHARADADRRQRAAVDPAGLLLGMVDVESALSNRLLHDAGVDLASIRRALLEVDVEGLEQVGVPRRRAGQDRLERRRQRVGVGWEEYRYGLRQDLTVTSFAVGARDAPCGRTAG